MFGIPKTPRLLDCVLSRVKTGIYLVTPLERKNVQGPCKGVAQMPVWISGNAILRLMTVFLILSAVLNRSKRKKLQWIINISMLAAALIVYGTSDNHHDLVMSLIGAATAAALALPLHHLKWMTRIDLLTTCIIGMHVGPAGFAFAFGIALCFVIVQHALKAHTTFMTGSPFPMSPFYPLVHLRGTIRPSLVEMESQRMLKDDRKEGITFVDSGADCREGSPISLPPARDEILPWVGKIALATLAVLMLGIPS